MSKPYREALEVVLEALNIPHAVTVGNEEIRAKILDARLMHAVLLLERILDDEAHPDIAWSIAYLRERLAEHPPVGYVTQDQADELLGRGVPWMDAVTPPTNKEIDR